MKAQPEIKCLDKKGRKAGEHVRVCCSLACPQVALVSQEPVLFADSIFANIAFGLAETPSMAQVPERLWCWRCCCWGCPVLQGGAAALRLRRAAGA